MTKNFHRSPWFDIEQDGNPAIPGWYEVLYVGQAEDQPDEMYFDGCYWRHSPHVPMISDFGNHSNSGERWRGAAGPHGGYYV